MGDANKICSVFPPCEGKVLIVETYDTQTRKKVQTKQEPLDTAKACEAMRKDQIETLAKSSLCQGNKPPKTKKESAPPKQKGERGSMPQYQASNFSSRLWKA